MLLVLNDGVLLLCVVLRRCDLVDVDLGLVFDLPVAWCTLLLGFMPSTSSSGLTSALVALYTTYRVGSDMSSGIGFWDMTLCSLELVFLGKQSMCCELFVVSLSLQIYLFVQSTSIQYVYVIARMIGFIAR